MPPSLTSDNIQFHIPNQTRQSTHQVKLTKVADFDLQYVVSLTEEILKTYSHHDGLHFRLLSQFIRGERSQDGQVDASLAVGL